MTADLVLHGHFYQPPREDPWTGIVPAQPSAAPFHDWNERVTDECYLPNTAVPLPTADGHGRVVNTFEHLSFDVGPTLLSWLEVHRPEVYGAILAADGTAGRAIAQAYGHAILPLCNEADLRTQVRWGIVDFEHRFGRRPAGMWLPETAVSDAVLLVLAEEGIGFTILAPGQIDAVRPVGADDDAWQPFEPAPPGAPQPQTVRPFRWLHPDVADRAVDLVVYDGVLAHALAFGHPNSTEILDATRGRQGMVVAATDGETFGHHHPGAQQAVAHALTIGAAERGIHVPRLADLLVERPPQQEARVRVSAWSCAHGLERWKADCGCHTGGHEGWNQAWRAPLRRALDELRDWGVALVDRLGPTLLRDPWAARDDYLSVLVGACPWEHFAAAHVVGDQHRAGLLLDAQRNALLMYTSCGWFFNDLAGIETLQILRYAARAVDLYLQLGEAPPLDEVLDILAEARSNDPDIGDGRRIWQERVWPR